MVLIVRKEFKFMFCMQILERQLPGVDDLNARLLALILERESAGGGMLRSNVGGWHSEADFLRWGAPECDEFFRLLAPAIKDYVAVERRIDSAQVDITVVIQAWANVMRHGGYAKPHVHPNANLSGVYYVDAGDSPSDRANSGVIDFIDPRGRPHMFETPGTLAQDSYRVSPRSGLLLLFPAWVMHYVNPYYGERPRVGLAFNVTIQQLEITRTRNQ